MSLVAAEMKRTGMSQPLMIGGATTSRVHTALRIEPNYDRGVVWVKGASHAVGVARKLCVPSEREALRAEVSAEYADCLLYTSPSPRDQRGSRMPSSA